MNRGGVAGLGSRLERLMRDPARRGREWMLAYFTQTQVAARTMAVFGR